MAPEGLVVAHSNGARVVAYFHSDKFKPQNKETKERNNRMESNWDNMKMDRIVFAENIAADSVPTTHINYIIYDTCRNNGHARA